MSNYADRLCKITVGFNNIYGWGEGYLRDTAEKSRMFWNVEFPKMKNCYWRLLPSEGFGDCEQLVTTSGSVYFHPMGFSTVLKSSGGYCIRNGKKDYFFCIDELEKICKAYAEYLGGSYTMNTSEKEVEF